MNRLGLDPLLNAFGFILVYIGLCVAAFGSTFLSDEAALKLKRMVAEKLKSIIR